MIRVQMLSAMLWAAAVQAQPLEDPIPETIPIGDIKVRLTTIADGLAASLYVTVAPGQPNTLYVVDQIGQVRMIESGVLVEEPFLDVSDLLVDVDPAFDERGLLGLAFHPGFADPESPGFGKLYTFTSEPVTGVADFTTSEPPPEGEVFDHQNVVAEWQISDGNPLQVDVGSRRELFRVDHPQFNHNAGNLAFGHDGFLYVSYGDGGGADDQDGQPLDDGFTFGHGPDGNGQNINTIHGSILRIDVDGNDSANGQYGIPADNPFVGTDGLDEIFAYGLRNPYGFSIDRETGIAYAGDCGQNDVNEVDQVLLGNNYGWRVKEGTFLFEPNGAEDGFVFENSPGVPPEMTDPFAQYDQDEGLCSVGGFVYRGSAIPELVGKYVFGDFSRDFGPTGRLFYADIATGEILEFDLDGRADLDLFVKGFGEDAAGELYLLASEILGPEGDTGMVIKIEADDGTCAGDANNDGVVDPTDLGLVLSLFGCDLSNEPNCGSADQNRDGIVDPLDVGYIMARFNTCD